jgi:hypothetical protein
MNGRTQREPTGQPVAGELIEVRAFHVKQRTVEGLNSYHDVAKSKSGRTEYFSGSVITGQRLKAGTIGQSLPACHA